MIDFTKATQVYCKPKLWLYASSIQEAIDKLPNVADGDMVINWKGDRQIALFRQEGVCCVVNVMTAEDWHNVNMTLKRTLTAEEIRLEKGRG